MARERIIKDPPKRGKLTKNQVKRAVEKVVFGKHSDGKAMPSGQYSKTRLCLGIPGIELQNPDMLQAFVEMGLLPPDVPLDESFLGTPTLGALASGQNRIFRCIRLTRRQGEPMVVPRGS